MTTKKNIKAPGGKLTNRNNLRTSTRPQAVSMTQIMARTNAWRDSYNPMRGLNMTRVVSLLEEAQRGVHANVQWLYSFIERRDADLSALIERRTSALLELDWNVKICDQKKYGKLFDQTLAENQQAYLTSVYNQFENLYEAIEHLAMASFRQFAHCQLQGKRFELLDQWNFIRDGLHGAWHWNPSANALAASSLDADSKLDPDRDLIIWREHPRPINEIALVKWIRQNLSQKDWDAFVEIYGLPGWIVIMPPNIPKGKEGDYETAASAVAEGASGALPHGADAKCADQPRGISPFEAYMDYLTKKLILAGTGGMLTMLAESGTGTLAGSAHMEAFEMIAKAEARKISEVFQKQLDKKLLAGQFPGQPVLAYFEIAANEETDTGEVIEQVVQLSNAGYQVDVGELAEKTGFSLTLKPEAAATAPYQSGFYGNRKLSNRAPGEGADALVESGVQSVGKALAEDLQPVRNRLEAILQVEDDELRNAALRKLQSDLPEILLQINAEPAGARALEEVLAAALVNGFGEAQ